MHAEHSRPSCKQHFLGNSCGYHRECDMALTKPLPPPPPPPPSNPVNMKKTDPPRTSTSKSSPQRPPTQALHEYHLGDKLI